MSLVTLLYPTSPVNGGAFLCRRAIDSLLDQRGLIDYDDWRLVVVVIGNNDQYSRAEASIADPRLTWVYNAKIKSLSVALQFGLAYADPRTELIGFCHDEYEFLPFALRDVLMAWRDRKPNLGVIYGDEIEYDRYRMPVDRLTRPALYDRKLAFDLVLARLPTCFFSYNFLMARHGFEILSEETPDADMLLRLGQYGVHKLNRPLAKHWHTHWGPPVFTGNDIVVRASSGMYGAEAETARENWNALNQIVLAGG